MYFFISCLRYGNCFDPLCPKCCAFWFIRGYTAPEYVMHGQLSEKVDTYCYGVVVLEIISGQKSGESKDGDEGEFLLQRVSKSLQLI